MNKEISVTNSKAPNQVNADRMKTIRVAMAAMRKKRMPEKEVQEAIRKFWATFKQ